MERELILVYNVESGFFNMIKDGFQKTFLPTRYQCNFCILTYGKFLKKDEWNEFIDQLNILYTFLHRDEFYKKLEAHPDHLKEVKFPAILLNRAGRISLFIDHKEINQCQTLTELMDMITSKLKNEQP